MAQYTHTPLPPNTIRVLHLQPGPPDSPLRGRLAPHPLPQTTTTTPASDPPASDYDCVSYVWGSDEKPFTILLSDNHPLPITATLHSLLRRLRKLFLDNGDEDIQTLPVWADAICIDQGEPVEKGEQVALMPAIYRGARRVVVDLGEEGEDDMDDVVWLMSAWWRKHIWSGVDLEGLDIKRLFTPREAGMLLGFEVPCDWEREALEGVELPGDEDPRWEAAARFFRRPWFERLWVVQEFVLAREVVMICGEREIPWREVAAASVDPISRSLWPINGTFKAMVQKLTFQLMAYQRQAKELLRTAEGREVVRSLGDAAGGKSALDLYWLLDTFQAKNTTHSRDKYFGLVGMAVDVKGDEPELRPDYVSPLETVVSRAGRWLWKAGRGRHILLTGGLSHQSGIDIPSWVPDFSTSGISTSRWFMTWARYNAAGDTGFHFTLTSEADHLVTLSAIRVDVVDRDPFAELPFLMLSRQASEWDACEDDIKSDVLLLFKQVAFNLRAVLEDITSVSPVSAELSDEALCSALLFGIEGRRDSGIMMDRMRAIGFRWMTWLAVCGDVVDYSSHEAFEAWNSSLQREFKATADEVEESRNDFVRLVIHATMRQYQLTRTRRGRVSKLPSCFRRGDEIWVVRGVPLPLLLRRSTAYPGCYQLVGSCYVHGIMNGEALEEGPKFEQLTLC